MKSTGDLAHLTRSPSVVRTHTVRHASRRRQTTNGVENCFEFSVFLRFHDSVDTRNANVSFHDRDTAESTRLIALAISIAVRQPENIKLTRGNYIKLEHTLLLSFWKFLDPLSMKKCRRG